MPIYFCVTDERALTCLGEQPNDDTAVAVAGRCRIEMRLLLSQTAAVLLLRRLQLFGALEPLPGLAWFTHLEWDGKLYLLEELGSRDEAEAILASCDDEPVALLDPAQMRVWSAVLANGLRNSTSPAGSGPGTAGGRGVISPAR